MVPLVKTLVHRLGNEPVFFLSALAAVAVVFNDSLPLPTWVQVGALAVFGIATRSVVKGPLS